MKESQRILNLEKVLGGVLDTFSPKMLFLVSHIFTKLSVPGYLDFFVIGSGTARSSLGWQQVPVLLEALLQDTDPVSPPTVSTTGAFFCHVKYWQWDIYDQ